MPHDFKRQAEGKLAGDSTAQRLPYDSSSRAREIVLTRETVFVRVHGEGNQPRSWLMRPEDLKDANGKNLTPQQIKDKFALPELPKYVSDVRVPPNTRLRVGTAAAQEGWGAGGGTQYELKERVPETAFENKRPLE
jgi:filamentous hemagglutinin